MKKLLLILVGGFVVVTGASYFIMQWKVKDSIDQLFASLFFVDASYDNATLDINGQIIVSGIELFIPSNQITVEIGSVSLAPGGLMAALAMDKDFENGKIPDSLALKITGFSMNIDSQVIDALESVYEPGMAEQVFALGCGEYLSLGPKQLFDLGLRTLSFDLSLGYNFNLPSDQLTSNIELYLDGIGHLIVDQTYIGFAPVMQNYKSALTSFDPSKIIPIDLDVQYVDLGYNGKVHEFCAKSSELSKSEWLKLNRSMFAAVLDDVEFESDLDAIKLYSDVMDERSRINLNMRPLPSFKMEDMAFYDMSQLIELLELTLIVNNESVDVSSLTWNQAKLAALDLATIRKKFQVGPKVEVVAIEAEQRNSSERILTAVPASTLEQHLHRNVYLERKDGKTFSGELLSVTRDRIVVRTRLGSGYTDLPLIRKELASVKLYPEN